MTPLFILEFVVALAVLLFLHELGHFIACRICKIEVEEFGFGLPPRAVKLFRAGGTDFTLNWIPFGGFVRPRGETDPDVSEGLASSSPWKRIFVALSGPFMNLSLAVVIYIVIIFIVGEPDPTRLNVTEVQGVMRSSPAEQAGLLSNDILLTINDTELLDQDHARQMLRDNVDHEITLQIQRGDEMLEIKATPLSDRSAQQGALGVALGSPLRPVAAFRAIGLGFQYTYEHIRMFFELTVQLIRGQLPAQSADLMGPVGIGEAYVQIRQFSPVGGIYPLVDALFFFINITLSFGLLNLLPIPILDGGRIMLTLPELVLRKRIPKKVEYWLNYGSYSLLMLLLIVVFLRDIVNLFI